MAHHALFAIFLFVFGTAAKNATKLRCSSEYIDQSQVVCLNDEDLHYCPQSSVAPWLHLGTGPLIQYYV